MSGPYCESCKFFHVLPFSGGEKGECTDRAKIIYDRSGNDVNYSPEVHIKNSCVNHSSVKQKGGQS